MIVTDPSSWTFTSGASGAVLSGTEPSGLSNPFNSPIFENALTFEFSFALPLANVTSPFSPIVTPSGVAPSIFHLLSLPFLTFIVFTSFDLAGVNVISKPSTAGSVGGATVITPVSLLGVTVGGGGSWVSVLGFESFSYLSYALALMSEAFLTFS